MIKNKKNIYMFNYHINLNFIEKSCKLLFSIIIINFKNKEAVIKPILN